MEMESENQPLTPQAKSELSTSLQFFLYLVIFLALGFVAFGVGNILFEFTNKMFPDLVSFNYQATFDQSVVKFAISSLFVAAPIFFILMKKISGFLLEKRISLESPARKWLTYLVLFFSAGTIIGDLITLLNNFLSGDVPARFLLKVLIVLVISGAIFGYYLWDVRRKEIVQDDSTVNKSSFIASILVVLAVFISGFFVIDSPTVSRQKNLDQQVVNNLQAVDDSIQSYFTEAGKLPQKLDELQSTKFSSGIQNAKNITYKAGASDAYELCADFQRSSLSDVSLQNEPYMNEWKHGAGNFCFSRTALQKTDVAPLPVK